MTHPIITQSTMFGPLLEADPSFAPQWAEFLAEWMGEGEPPLYMALGDLALHLVRRVMRSDTDGFDQVFDVVEQWHVHGDAFVKEAATIGLLEGIQNQFGDEQFGRRNGQAVQASDFELWLRPETRRWWDKLNRFWDGEIGALQNDT